MTDLSALTLLGAFAVALVAGAIKGAVGFAMPMIMISGLSSLMAPELALAALILPTLLTNGVQALRQGVREAWGSVRRFRVFLIVGGLCLAASAQLVPVLAQDVLLIMIGAPLIAFGAVQLAGWRPKVTPSLQTEAGVGVVAGTIGGMSGIWGPPTVLYLTAIDTAKADQMRIQGVIYGLGAALLALAHIRSGVFSPPTWSLSALLVIPSLLGMWVGFMISDRIDQATFRKATLVVLVIAGANLIRRGLLG